MRETVLNGVRIQCVEGDITRQDDVEAVVNAANAALMPGAGVAGAIHVAAGPGLAEECRPLAPIAPGEAVITGAHLLPNEHVIHCLGPVYGRDEPSDQILRSCYLSALMLGEVNGVGSIAFPAISTGVFGYPLEEAADVALSAVAEATSGLDSIRLVRFTLFGADALGVHVRALEALG
jgi:O-acetyl-ADP-ribose deacetylase (regulator of RNase III)